MSDTFTDKAETKMFIDRVISKLHDGKYEALRDLGEDAYKRDMKAIHNMLAEAANFYYGE